MRPSERAALILKTPLFEGSTNGSEPSFAGALSVPHYRDVNSIASNKENSSKSHNNHAKVFDNAETIRRQTAEKLRRKKSQLHTFQSQVRRRVTQRAHDKEKPESVGTAAAAATTSKGNMTESIAKKDANAMNSIGVVASVEAHCQAAAAATKRAEQRRTDVAAALAAANASTMPSSSPSSSMGNLSSSTANRLLLENGSRSSAPQSHPPSKLHSHAIRLARSTDRAFAALLSHADSSSRERTTSTSSRQQCRPQTASDDTSSARRRAWVRKQRAAADRRDAHTVRMEAKVAADRQEEEDRERMTAARAAFIREAALREAAASIEAAEEERRAEVAAAEAAAEKKKLGIARRRREAVRYINALRSVVMAECRKSGRGVPVLCSCRMTSEGGTDEGMMMIPGWEHCTNNCVFFQNPEGYGRALKGLWKAMQADGEMR